MRSLGSEHSSPVECNDLIQDVVMETALCKDVSTSVSDFPLQEADIVHFIFLQLDISQEQPEVQAGLMALIFGSSWVRLLWLGGRKMLRAKKV